MLHRFATFEIDEPARELRTGGRVLDLQPRVFDLLVYLVKNRERVVTKDELLKAVWPGVIVTDGSLQRAVSLARTALMQAGAENAIHTHSRQGYRFRFDAPADDTATGDITALATARVAYERGDWEGTLAAFKQLGRMDALGPDDLQRWAHAAQCAERPLDAVGPLERAVSAFSARGDRRRAAWAAILIAQLRSEWRETAIANGWVQQAARLLERESPCPEQGYLDLLRARLALRQNDLEDALDFAQRARAAGTTFNDPALENLALVLVGEVSLFLGKIREGLAAIDEAGASVVASSLSAWAGGLVYCSVIYSCLSRADWQRAGEWTQQFTQWCDGKGVAAYPGLCRLHRAEVLTVRGHLNEAESEVRATAEMLSRQAPWMEGDAWRALGDILLVKGEFAAARDAFAKATQLGWESQFGFALVLLVEGDASAAAHLLGRTLAGNAWSSRSRRGQALAYFAIASAIAGRVEDAHRALAEVESNPDLASTPALQAQLAQARAELHAAAGNTTQAIVQLRSAIRSWQELSAPLPTAQARCRLAEWLAADGDRESATLELSAAIATFQAAGADRLLTNCEKLRQTLTRRESDDTVEPTPRRRS
jgi:DNA-binding winged helix-turn-helix (wHTH) protein